MKRYLPLVFVAMLLAGCQEKPLTAAECRTVIQKEIQHLDSTVGEGGSAVARMMADSIDESTAQCVDQGTVSREYYECMRQTSDANGISACMKAKRERGE